MSRHQTLVRIGGRELLVVAGYDRPTKEVFLQVLVDDIDDPAADDAPLYSSLTDPHRDWRDAGTLVRVLDELGLVVPRSLLDAVRGDQLANAGNRVVMHYIDREPEVLLPG
ncbi:MAG: hypothetical protein WAQ05_09865 [Rubrivivax sp.]|jgi:hypothetical protein